MCTHIIRRVGIIPIYENRPRYDRFYGANPAVSDCRFHNFCAAAISLSTSHIGLSTTTRAFGDKEGCKCNAPVRALGYHSVGAAVPLARERPPAFQPAR